MFKSSTKSYLEIFHYIISKGKTTRRDIEKSLGYSWGTVSTQVCKLMDEGYVIETECFSSGLGRNTYYLIPNNNIVTIGVDLNAVGLSCTVAGLDGSELKCFLSPYFALTPDDVLNLIYDSFDKGFAWANERNLPIFSIGLSCQGGVDDETGTFEHFYFVKDWKAINIKKLLIEKYKKFVYISNDIGPLVADYIRRFGQKDDKAIIVRLVDGIGFGFTDLDSFPSLTLVKSDFGHMIMVPDGQKCICGKNGCLEAYCSIRGIMMRSGLSLDQREELFEHPEKYEKQILEAAHMLAIGIINVISGFSISSIILTGRMIEFGDKFINKIQETYDKYKGELEPNIKIKVIANLSASLGVATKSAERKIMYE